MTASSDSSSHQVNLERARADDASDRLTQIASLVDSEWMRGPQVTASEAQHVAERGIAKLRSQLGAAAAREVGELTPKELEDALGYVSRSIRRLTNATADIAASAAPIPLVMQAPLLGDLLLTIETLEHHITQNHTVRAEHLQLQKAHAVLHKHIGQCTKALELVARRETKGVAEDLAQLSASATELVGDAQHEQEVEAANLAKKLIAAVLQASSGKLAPGTYTSIPATSEPMLFECIEAHTAGNGSQLSVPVGGTVLVQKLHEGMLEAQIVNEGERVGSVGWIPVKCVSASPVQLAQLECKLLLDQHDSQATQVLLLRTQISQLERALADVEDKHASELMAARSRSKRSADDRVSEERIRCAKQIDDFRAQLDFAKAETQTVRAEMKAAVDSLHAEIKAIKEKNE